MKTPAGRCASISTASVSATAGITSASSAIALLLHSVLGHNLIVRSSCPGFEQAGGELPEPYRHARRVDFPAHQRAREQAIGDMHAELAIGFELLFIEELVERALVREI